VQTARSFFNDSSNDVDFRVESDNSQTALKVDGGTGIVSMSEGMAALTMSGNLTFGDNDKAVFGDELEIFSDATHARIREYGSGQLKIQGDNMQLLTSDGASTYLEGDASTGAVTLYHASNSPRIATTDSGIDIKFDGGGSQMGLDIHNQGTATGDDATITFETQGSRSFTMGLDRSALSFVIAESSTLATNPRLVINDDGKVGINTASPATTQRLHVYNAASGVSTVSTNTDLTVENSGNTGLSILTPAASNGQILFGDPDDNDVGRIQYNHPSDYMAFFTGATERVRITNNGDMRIGISTTAITGIGSDSRKNMVVGSTTGGEIVSYRADNQVASGDFIGAFLFGHDDNTGTEDHFAGVWAKATSSAGLMDIHFAGGITNYETDTPQMTLDSSGNLGIGTNSPSPDYGSDVALEIKGASSPGLVINDTGQADKYGIHADSNDLKITYGTGALATFQNDGNVLIGKTSASDSTDGIWLDGSGRLFSTNTSNYAAQFRRNGSNGVLIHFYNDNSAAGNISISGTTTSYNTSSDYRLKTDVQQITGASERVQALNPVNFEWIADGTRVDGFLAHEAQAVVPEAITGEKDAVDADGNAVMQGIDQSKMVPLLTAALQEALTKIDNLETRLTALEG